MNEKKTNVFSKIGYAYGIFLITISLGQLLVGWVLHLVNIDQSKSDLILLLSMTLPIYAIAFPILCLILKGIPVRRQVASQSFSWLAWLGIVVVCIGTTYWFNLLGQGLMKVADLIFRRTSENYVQEFILNVNPAVIFIAAVVLAPIMEELIFRKMLIDRLYEYGDLTVVLVSGFLFGVTHGNFYQFFYAFALGVIFAYIYRKTGKVLYIILLHMMINFLGSMIPLLLMDKMELNGDIGSMIAVVLFGLFVLILMVASLIVMGFFIPHLTFLPGAECGLPEPESGPAKKRPVVINTGMVFFCIVGLIGFLNLKR